MFNVLYELKTAIENYDIAAIDRLSENMQNFTQHQTHGEAVGELLRLTFVSKYKQAGILVNSILEA